MDARTLDRRDVVKTLASAAASVVFTGIHAQTPAPRTPGRPRRAAAIDVSHWHSIYDASYLRLLQQQNVGIVAVSDANRAIADDRAGRFGATAFVDYREMIDKMNPDFVVALGRHVDMPATFRYLVDTGIPFLMEKPWGVDAATVQGLATLAASRNTWVTVPFPYRFSHWAEAARTMVRNGELGAVSHIVFRLIRPTIDRYKEWDSPWMLRKAEAGGGALMNLGAHGFDLCRFITGEEPRVVSAVLSGRVHNGDVEDYALVTLKTPSGILFHNEVGYTMPTWPRNSTDGERKLAAAKGILRQVPRGINILGRDRDETIETPQGYVGEYPRVMAETLAALERGEPPPISATECARAVTLIHDAYRVAATLDR